MIKFLPETPEMPADTNCQVLSEDQEALIDWGPQMSSSSKILDCYLEWIESSFSDEISLAHCIAEQVKLRGLSFYAVLQMCIQSNKVNALNKHFTNGNLKTSGLDMLYKQLEDPNKQGGFEILLPGFGLIIQNLQMPRRFISGNIPQFNNPSSCRRFRFR